MPSSPAKPSVIPLFIPHAGCPNQCLFCNQRTVTGQSQPLLADLKGEIDIWLSRMAGRGPLEISFYGGTFLGLPEAQILSLLDLAQSHVDEGLVAGIRFSTRPDTITAKSLKLLSPYHVTTIEIGAQSMDESVLTASRRGHTAEDTRLAMALLASHPAQTVLQMMAGLPKETFASWKASVLEMLSLNPSAIRIYPTVVLDESPLYGMWKGGEYEPLSLDEAVKRTAWAYERACHAGVSVLRMGLQESDELRGGGICAGPHHPAFGHLVHSAIFLKKAIHLLSLAPCEKKRATFAVNPRSVSRLRGLKNVNIGILKERFGLSDLRVEEAPGIPLDGLVLK